MWWKRFRQVNATQNALGRELNNFEGVFGVEVHEGFTIRKEKESGFDAEIVDVLSSTIAQELGRQVGKYITIDAGVPIDHLMEVHAIGECLAHYLYEVLEPYFHGSLCICGVGNSTVPTDALGPAVTDRLPLRMFNEMATFKGSFTRVCSIAPGTSMTSGISTEQVVAGVVAATKSDCVLLVDSVITKEFKKLSRSFQITTSGGTNPYLSDKSADWSVVGAPVISLGVATGIAASILTGSVKDNKTILSSHTIPDIIQYASSAIAYALMRVCWPSLSKYECYIFTNGAMPLYCEDEDDGI